MREPSRRPRRPPRCVTRWGARPSCARWRDALFAAVRSLADPDATHARSRRRALCATRNGFAALIATTPGRGVVDSAARRVLLDRASGADPSLTRPPTRRPCFEPSRRLRLHSARWLPVALAGLVLAGCRDVQQQPAVAGPNDIGGTMVIASAGRARHAAPAARRAEHRPAGRPIFCTTASRRSATT